MRLPIEFIKYAYNELDINSVIIKYMHSIQLAGVISP